MQGVLTPDFISETLRQVRGLQRDIYARLAALALLFMVCGLRIEPAAPMAFALCYLLAEVATAGFAKTYLERVTLAGYAGLLIAAILGTVAVSMCMIAMWMQGDAPDRFIALFGLSGILLHVVFLRTPHLFMGLLTAAPIFMAYAGMVLLYYVETGDLALLLINLAGVSALMAYCISGMWAFYRIHINLIEARRIAQENSASKSQFLATMSHELRTPLNAILGVSQLLHTEPDSEQTPRRVAALERSARSLRGIVDDVLDMHTVEAGRIEIRTQAALLRDEVCAIVELHRALALEKDLALGVEVAEDVPEWLEYDALRVRQCLTNLLSNALKYTAAGQVQVQVGMEPGVARRVQIEVSDTGAGLPAEVRANLFAPGHHGQQSRARETGAGLGLPISRGIARAMGGDIVLRATGAQGTIFRLTFAVKTVEEEQLVELRRFAGARPALSERRAAHVLVVDDIATNCMITEAFLQAAGYDVTCCESGPAALDLAQQHRFDLVLLDMNMPVMSGLETFRRLRSAHPHLPVVALTADALPADRARYLSYGLTGYLAKPLDRDALIEEVRERLKGAHAA